MPLNSTQTYEIAVGCVLVTIATVSVAVRIYAKFVKKLGLSLDDWLAIASLVFLFGLLVELLLWATIGGNGVHIQDLSPEEVLTFFKIFFANELTYVMTTPCIKLSILALYHHIFFSVPFRMAVKIIATFVILFALAFFFAAAFQCTPVEAGWNKAVQGQCFNSQAYIEAFQSINIVLDIVILVLPMPMVWNLQREWQYKAALTGVFLLGGFVCAASIYRLCTLLIIDDNDITYSIYKATVWTFVEPSIGLLCACLPIIWGLFPSYKTVTTSRRHRSRKSTGVELKGYGAGHSANDGDDDAADRNAWTRLRAESVEEEDVLVEHRSATAKSSV